MPHRLVCLAILIFWTVAAGALITRDVLPTILVGAPPDLRTIAQADGPAGPVRWSILAVDPKNPALMRSVGQVTTETFRKRDGWVRMTSQAWLDTAEVLEGTVFAGAPSERYAIAGAAEVDSVGNLQNFRVNIRAEGRGGGEVLGLEGRLKRDRLQVTAQGPFFLHGTYTLPYRPREIVQNTLSPLDRMPGLQVGQTWEAQVVSPLTGGVQTCRVEVAGIENIFWGPGPVATLKVVTRMPFLSAATWVKPDGMVLRQEVPITDKIRLVLERLAEEPPDAPPAQKERRSR